MSRTNRQVCISFGRDEDELYEWWVQECKENQHISRSSYLKTKIREDRKNSNRKLVSV